MARITTGLIAASLLCITAGACPAQPADDGIEWVTISAPGNRGWDGDEMITGTVRGRGVVNYHYRIAKFEVTTAQWMEFVNTFSARPDATTAIVLPTIWGAEEDPFYFGPGVRYRLSPWLPTPAMVPVGGLDWRSLAMYCNWLHNGKSHDHAAAADGAYDTSTFGEDAEGGFTDQAVRSQGARYWIPSFDETWKAVYFDPALDYWYMYPHSADQPPITAPPGTGETNAGFGLPQGGHQTLPLGSYPESQSPWGLLDASGSMSEWTEETYERSSPFRRHRIVRGSHNGGDTRPDLGSGFSTRLPEFNELIMGGRIASAVPCPGDWDRSGGIDGDDIGAFIADWQQGAADIDQSGGTDGDDLVVFFTRWQAGC